MKKLLLLVLAAIVVIGAPSLAVSKQKEYQNKKTHDAAAAEQVDLAKAVSSVAASKDAQILALQKDKVSLRAECEKGLAAYAQLTPTIKTKVAAPVCSIAE